jgi:hypothetical protein
MIPVEGETSGTGRPVIEVGKIEPVLRKVGGDFWQIAPG